MATYTSSTLTDVTKFDAMVSGRADLLSLRCLGICSLQSAACRPCSHCARRYLECTDPPCKLCSKSDVECHHQNSPSSPLDSPPGSTFYGEDADYEGERSYHALKPEITPWPGRRRPWRKSMLGYPNSALNSSIPR